MLKIAVCSVALSFSLCGAALAQTCPQQRLSNGTTADATSVMAWFDCKASAANPTLNGTSYFTYNGNTYANIGPYGMWINTISLGPLSGGSAGTITADAASIYVRSNNWVYFQNPNTFSVSASIDGGGGTGVWATSFHNYSDARLKTNIQSLAGGLALVDQLRPVRYQFRTGADRPIGKTLSLPTNSEVGLIAQEVKAVIPEAVTSDKEGVYGINQAELVPVLIAAVKELHGEVESLKAQVAAYQSAHP